MCTVNDPGNKQRDPPQEPALPYSPDDLKAMQAGVSALISPSAEGWAVQYISGLEHETGAGTEFPTLEGALAAVQDLLPKANSEEERARLREMEELARLRQHDE
jgi:hypothetical protein